MARSPSMPLFVPRNFSHLGDKDISSRVLFRVNAQLGNINAGQVAFRCIGIESYRDGFQMTISYMKDGEDGFHYPLKGFLENCQRMNISFKDMFFDFVCRGYSHTSLQIALRDSDDYAFLRAMYYRTKFDLPRSVAPGDEHEYFADFYNEYDLADYTLDGFNSGSKQLIYPLDWDKHNILSTCDRLFVLRFKHRKAMLIETIATTTVEI